MIRSFLTVSSGTLASRLLGFLRDSMIAALVGTGPFADAFLAAFQLVNVIRRLLSEGALNAALVPVWLRLRESEGEAAAARRRINLVEPPSTETLDGFAAMLEAAFGAEPGITGIVLHYTPATALITQVLPAARDRAKDLGIINIAIVCPSALGALLAAPLVSLGGYPTLLAGTAVVGFLGSVLVWQIKSVP